MNRAQYKVTSPFGPLFLEASEKGLCGIHTKAQKSPILKRLDTSPLSAHLKQAKAELEEYFAGDRNSFTVKLHLDGTQFQQKVWKELSKIPYGKTVSYKDIAAKLGNKAFRAVGSANGKNPVCIVVPCHRVIAADGSLGGYSGGLKMKSWLLKHEGLSIQG